MAMGANGSAATLQVLSTAEVEMMWANMANHKAYLDQGFVRKLSARWSGLSKNQQAAVATRPSTSMAGIVVADTAPSDAFGTEKARPHSQWGHNLGASGRAVSPLPTRPQTSFVSKSVNLTSSTGGRRSMTGSPARAPTPLNTADG